MKQTDLNIKVNRVGNRRHYTAEHLDGAFSLSGTYQAGCFNVKVQDVPEKNLDIYLNVYRGKYFVVDNRRVNVSPYNMHDTLADAIGYASSYHASPPETDNLSRKTFLQHASETVMWLTCVIRNGKPVQEEPREVIRTGKNKIAIKVDGKERWLYLDLAKQMHYNGTTLQIFVPAFRLLNEAEFKVLDGWEKQRDLDAEMADLMSDSSVEFWRKKHYFEETDFEYLFSAEHKGRYLYSSNVDMVKDNQIRGQLAMEYKVEFAGWRM